MMTHTLRCVAFVFVISTLFQNCSSEKKNDMKDDQISIDKHSYADPSEAVVTHLNWNASIDFERKTINAIADLSITTQSSAKHLKLDTKNLNITEVKDKAGNALNFTIDEAQPHLGSALIIDITPAISHVLIKYSTSTDAEALQWLDPVQTAGKKQPFLFTQSQAILARSWIPIQDSPGIRFTYEATVQVPSDLMALMSASNPTSKSETGLYHFEMKQAIPAYLMALTVGDVEFASLGNRSGVYSEASVLESASYEFEDIEKMISAAEELYGPYRWERYDLIVLPPSFPFGGMENPRLTFATPTILAGDKSLTSLVAHELAHSWSGNLVTNANWNDFWLNEGFTVYFENRIMEAVYGRSYSEMLATLSLQDLKDEIEDITTNGLVADTHLKLNLDGRNPDDGMTTIAYDKGYYFLRLLEETVGRVPFDAFLKNYFTENSFQTMTTEQFIVKLRAELFEANGLALDNEFYEEWIYGPGLPANCPTPKSDKFTNVDLALKAWIANADKNVMEKDFGTNDWSTHEWLSFVRNLPSSMNESTMKNLDDAFSFTSTGNSEIFAAWSIHIIANKYEKGYANLERFLVNTGRRKFLTPLYREMIKTEEGTKMAKGIYAKARPNYHFVSSSSIDELLK